MRLGGHQSRSVRDGEDKVLSLLLPGIEPRSPSPQPSLYMTELPRLITYVYIISIKAPYVEKTVFLHELYLYL